MIDVELLGFMGGNWLIYKSQKLKQNQKILMVPSNWGAIASNFTIGFP
jgi:hypothetical protein